MNLGEQTELQATLFKEKQKYLTQMQENRSTNNN